MKRSLLFTGALGLVAWGLSLFLRQAARWAGSHPALDVAAVMVAVPLVTIVVRGMPSRRELRRALREGMAGAETAPAPALAYAEGDVVAPSRPAAPVLGADVLPLLDGDAFERAVARLCERDGCLDVEVVGGAGDLGADVVARTPEGRRLVIQCKRYAADNKVGSQDLQRFGGTCYSVHAADIAVLVTTSTVTAPAAAYAESVGILCCDGPLVAAWYEGTGSAPWLWAEAGDAPATPDDPPPGFVPAPARA